MRRIGLGRQIKTFSAFLSQDIYLQAMHSTHLMDICFIFNVSFSSWLQAKVTGFSLQSLVSDRLAYFLLSSFSSVIPSYINLKMHLNNLFKIELVSSPSFSRENTDVQVLNMFTVPQPPSSSKYLWGGCSWDNPSSPDAENDGYNSRWCIALHLIQLMSNEGAALGINM